VTEERKPEEEMDRPDIVSDEEPPIVCNFDVEPKRKNRIAELKAAMRKGG